MKAAALNMVMDDAKEEIRMADGVPTDKRKVHIHQYEYLFG